MAVFKSSNHLPNLNEIDLTQENTFQCMVNTSGENIKAYKMQILSGRGDEIIYDPEEPTALSPVVKNKKTLYINGVKSQMEGVQEGSFINGNNYQWGVRVYNALPNSSTRPNTLVCDGFLVGSTKYVLWCQIPEQDTTNKDALEQIIYDRYIEFDVAPENVTSQVVLSAKEDPSVVLPITEGVKERRKIDWVTSKLGYNENIVKIETTDNFTYNFVDGTPFKIYQCSDEHTVKNFFADPNSNINVSDFVVLFDNATNAAAAKNWTPASTDRPTGLLYAGTEEKPLSPERKITGYSSDTGEIRINEAFETAPENGNVYRIYEFDRSTDTYVELKPADEDDYSTQVIGGQPIENDLFKIISNKWDESEGGIRRLFIQPNINIKGDITNPNEIVFNSYYTNQNEQATEKTLINTRIDIPEQYYLNEQSKKKVDITFDKLDNTQWMLTANTGDKTNVTELYPTRVSSTSELPNPIPPQLDYSIYTDFMDSMPYNLFYARSAPTLNIQYKDLNENDSYVNFDNYEAFLAKLQEYFAEGGPYSQISFTDEETGLEDIESARNEIIVYFNEVLNPVYYSTIVDAIVNYTRELQGIVYSQESVNKTVEIIASSYNTHGIPLRNMEFNTEFIPNDDIGQGIKYYRYNLYSYNSNGVAELINKLDDTYSSELIWSYRGLLSGAKYKVEIVVVDEYDKEFKNSIDFNIYYGTEKAPAPLLVDYVCERGAMLVSASSPEYVKPTLQNMVYITQEDAVTYPIINHPYYFVSDETYYGETYTGGKYYSWNLNKFIFENISDPFGIKFISSVEQLTTPFSGIYYFIEDITYEEKIIQKYNYYTWDETTGAFKEMDSKDKPVLTIINSVDRLKTPAFPDVNSVYYFLEAITYNGTTYSQTTIKEDISNYYQWKDGKFQTSRIQPVSLSNLYNQNQIYDDYILVPNNVEVIIIKDELPKVGVEGSYYYFQKENKYYIYKKVSGEYTWVEIEDPIYDRELYYDTVLDDSFPNTKISIPINFSYLSQFQMSANFIRTVLEGSEGTQLKILSVGYEKLDIEKYKVNYVEITAKTDIASVIDNDNLDTLYYIESEITYGNTKYSQGYYLWSGLVFNNVSLREVRDVENTTLLQGSYYYFPVSTYYDGNTYEGYYKWGDGKNNSFSQIYLYLVNEKNNCILKFYDKENPTPDDKALNCITTYDDNGNLVYLDGMNILLLGGEVPVPENYKYAIQDNSKGLYQTVYEFPSKNATPENGAIYRIYTPTKEEIEQQLVNYGVVATKDKEENPYGVYVYTSGIGWSLEPTKYVYIDNVDDMLGIAFEEKDFEEGDVPIVTQKYNALSVPINCRSTIDENELVNIEISGNELKLSMATDGAEPYYEPSIEITDDNNDNVSSMELNDNVLVEDNWSMILYENSRHDYQIYLDEIDYDDLVVVSGDLPENDGGTEKTYYLVSSTNSNYEDGYYKYETVTETDSETESQVEVTKWVQINEKNITRYYSASVNSKTAGDILWSDGNINVNWDLEYDAEKNVYLNLPEGDDLDYYMVNYVVYYDTDSNTYWRLISENDSAPYWKQQDGINRDNIWVDNSVYSNQHTINSLSKLWVSLYMTVTYSAENPIQCVIKSEKKWEG